MRLGLGLHITGLRAGGEAAPFALASFFSGAAPSDAITHTRAGNATMVDSDGLLKWAPHNLALNSATPATQSITVVSGADYTVECTGVSIALSGAGTGTVTEGSPVTITASTGTLTLTVTGSSGTVWAYRSDLGGMVDNPDRGDSYVPTTTTAVYLPRRGHHIWDGSAWVNEGLLHESEARTNLLTYSNDFVAASWGAYQTTVTSNDAASPDGNINADLITSAASNDVHRIQLSSGTTISASTNYTLSVFVKAGTHDFVTIGYYTGSEQFISATFDLSAGTEATETNIGTTSGTIIATQKQEFENGWFRLSVSGSTLGASALCFICVAQSATGNAYTNFGQPVWNAAGTETFYVYGAQFEQGPVPSSYIPTSGATVTRAADTLTIPAANLPWSPDAVSIQMQGAATGEAYTASRWYADANNYITQEINSSDFTFEQADGGTVDAVTGGTFSPGINVPYNIASRHGSTFINGAVDGTALTEDTTPTALPDLETTDLQLGFDYMGTIKQFRVWGRDIGDTGIAQETA